MRLEHLGIAVANLESSIETYERLLNTACYKREQVSSENVETAFFKTGESKVELVSDMGEGTTISRFIEARGQGIHHVAFEVTDIYAEMKRLTAQGFRVLYAEPKEGADNKLINFVHPKDAHGVLIEICQERNH